MSDDRTRPRPAPPAAPARPDLAVTATTVDEVRAALRRAVTDRLAVRVHSTGRAAGGVRPVRGGLLLRTRMTGGVRVDRRQRIARIPAGATWGEVVAATAPHGLTAAHGPARAVGAVGHLLSGGVSLYGRCVGLAANAVRAVELVTADGTLRRVHVAADPELFAALRGGGGGFGVVTAVEIGLFPVTEVVTGAAYWPVAEAGELLRTWLGWTRDAPRAATTSVRVLSLPPSPHLPPALTAGPVFVVDGAVVAAVPAEVPGARAAAADLLGPLRAIAEPVLDTWAPTGPGGVFDAHGDPTDPVPRVGDHMLLGELDDAGAAAFLAAAGPGSGSPLAAAGLQQLGGRFTTGAPGGGVLDRLTARFSYAGSGPAADPASAAAVRAHCSRVRRALRPWDTGLTVPGLVEDVGRPQRHLDEAALDLVDAVRDRVDPHGLFRGDVAPGASAERAARAA
jgi:hypothetical protein